MKSNFQSILWFLIAPMLILACSKDVDPPVNQSEMWDCHHKTAWDSMKTANALIGEWEWEYISCFWVPEKANYDDFRGLTIEFKSNDTLIVRENGKTTQTSTWKVVDGDADLFAVETSPTVGHLYGRILFCDKRVEFNDSYIDGCDNYFKRK